MYAIVVVCYFSFRFGLFFSLQIIGIAIIPSLPGTQWLRARSVHAESQLAQAHHAVILQPNLLGRKTRVPRQMRNVAVLLMLPWLICTGQYNMGII